MSSNNQSSTMITVVTASLISGAIDYCIGSYKSNTFGKINVGGPSGITIEGYMFLPFTLLFML
jgi:hypothetical protein